MKGKVLIWTLLSIIGGTLVALPDQGPRLITFSEAHGPGLVDMLGIILVIIGWLIIILGIWNRREKILQYNGSRMFATFLIIIGMSYGMIISSVFSDFIYWWAVGILMIILVHIFVLYMIMKK